MYNTIRARQFLSPLIFLPVKEKWKKWKRKTKSFALCIRYIFFFSLCFCFPFVKGYLCVGFESLCRSNLTYVMKNSAKLKRNLANQDVQGWNLELVQEYGYRWIILQHQQILPSCRHWFGNKKKKTSMSQTNKWRK